MIEVFQQGCTQKHAFILLNNNVSSWEVCQAALTRPVEGWWWWWSHRRVWPALLQTPAAASPPDSAEETPCSPHGNRSARRGRTSAGIRSVHPPLWTCCESSETPQWKSSRSQITSQTVSPVNGVRFGPICGSARDVLRSAIAKCINVRTGALPPKDAGDTLRRLSSSQWRTWFLGLGDVPEPGDTQLNGDLWVVQHASVWVFVCASFNVHRSSTVSARWVKSAKDGINPPSSTADQDECFQSSGLL